MKKNVLIFSWFGATNKQLDKFNVLYNKLGYKPTIIKSPIIKSMSHSSWKKMEIQRYAR